MDSPAAYSGHHNEKSATFSFLFFAIGQLSFFLHLLNIPNEPLMAQCLFYIYAPNGSSSQRSKKSLFTV
ncbi:hypothetical protein ACFSQ7_22185 [Paenibacillus rhizoplanae]